MTDVDAQLRTAPPVAPLDGPASIVRGRQLYVVFVAHVGGAWRLEVPRFGIVVDGIDGTHAAEHAARAAIARALRLDPSGFDVRTIATY